MMQFGCAKCTEVMREQQKAFFERERFLAVAALAGLGVVADSIENRRPPEPDILCRLVNGERVAFELLELVDEDEARTISTASNEGFWIGDPTARNLRRKLVEKKHKYASDHPMELIAFGGDTLGPKNVWVPTHDNNLVRDWLAESPFRRLRVVNIAACPTAASLRSRSTRPTRRASIRVMACCAFPPMAA